MQDSLDIRIDDIDTNYPRILPNIYDLLVKEAEVVPNKAQTGENLVISFATQAPTNGVSDDVVNAGHVIRHNISLTPTEKYPIESIARSLASLAKSAGLSGITPREIKANPAVLAGKVVRAKVGLEKETTQFPEKNVIVAFVLVK